MERQRERERQRETERQRERDRDRERERQRERSELKISQYADDTILILDGSETSLVTALETIENFGKISGLRLNSKKTEALWIGSKAGEKRRLCPEKQLKWLQYKVKTLGVWLSTNPEVTRAINYEEKIKKIKNTLNTWELRRLTLLGKITVLRSLAASQLVYVLPPLKTNEKAITETNELFLQFFMEWKRTKTKRNVIIADYTDGGLRMLDIASFNKALKFTWIKKYLDKDNHGK